MLSVLEFPLFVGGYSNLQFRGNPAAEIGRGRESKKLQRRCHRSVPFEVLHGALVFLSFGARSESP